MLAEQIESTPATPKLVSEDKAAEILGISVRAMRVRRCNGNPLLSFVRVGRRILYRLSTIESFISENEVHVGN